MAQHYNKRLADKLKETNPAAFDKMRCGFIENEIRASGYPSENAELAILRKQIDMILSILKEKGINAEQRKTEQKTVAAYATQNPTEQQT